MDILRKYKKDIVNIQRAIQRILVGSADRHDEVHVGSFRNIFSSHPSYLSGNFKFISGVARVSYIVDDDCILWGIPSHCMRLVHINDLYGDLKRHVPIDSIDYSSVEVTIIPGGTTSTKIKNIKYKDGLWLYALKIKEGSYRVLYKNSYRVDPEVIKCSGSVATDVFSPYYYREVRLRLLNITELSCK
jgi:hypothetical protein